jgi:hypothetical protein
VKSYNAEIATKESVEFIHFSLDRTPKAALAWAKKENFPWAHILPDQHSDSGLKKYAKNYVPYYMLIDKEGKILAEGKQAVFAKVRAL